jgi:hypothetical protein
MFVVLVFFSAIGGWGAPAPPFDWATTLLLTGRVHKTESKSRKGKREWFFMNHLPDKSTEFKGEILWAKQPAHGRLIVNRSTARGISPTRTHILAILNNARHRRIAAGKLEHLCAPRAIVLGVVVEKRNTF